MALNGEKYTPLFLLLEAISSFDIELLNDTDVIDEESSQLKERGPLPLNENSKKTQLYNNILSNRKKKSIGEKINVLKDILQQKNEVNGIKTFATLINEIFDPNQMNIFMTEMRGDIEIQESTLSGAVINPINFDDGKLKLPIASSYNPSEIYLIHKGIQQCRCLLHRYNKILDKTMIEELRTKSVLETVITEEIGQDKNYIMILADTYPKSSEEIKLLFREEPDVLLKSSFFSNLALNNIQYLHEMVLDLTKSIDKVKLSRSCRQSNVNGIYLSTWLQRNNAAEMKGYVDSIMRFICRYN